MFDYLSGIMRITVVIPLGKGPLTLKENPAYTHNTQTPALPPCLPAPYQKGAFREETSFYSYLSCAPLRSFVA